MREIPVLFENDCCLVLNKPSGLAVQGGAGVKISLDSILSEKIRPRPLLVHRLDRDTSGVILVAKTKEAASLFSGLFAGSQARASSGANVKRTARAPTLIKRYLGICAGIPQPERGTITAALDIRGKQRESGTSYRLLSSGNAAELPVSLLELELETGRMHQIRRHLADFGHPLLGDDKYGDFSLNKSLRKTHAVKFLLLHASRLIIPPLPGLVRDGLDVEAPLPDYFSRFLEAVSPAGPGGGESPR